MESSVTSRKLAVIAGFIFVTVLALLSLVVFPAPSYDWRAPRSAPRDHRAVPLRVIIEDLERNRVIPAGTTWESSELKERRVTVGWFLSRDRAVLEYIAKAGEVVIGFPMGHHGEVWGPISIGEARHQAPAGVFPRGRGDMPYSGVR